MSIPSFNIFLGTVDVGPWSDAIAGKPVCFRVLAGAPSSEIRTVDFAPDSEVSPDIIVGYIPDGRRAKVHRIHATVGAIYATAAMPSLEVGGSECGAGEQAEPVPCESVRGPDWVPSARHFRLF